MTAQETKKEGQLVEEKIIWSGNKRASLQICFSPAASNVIGRCFPALSCFQVRDQREWVFEVREVKSENKKLSLFFEKCKVKKNAFTLFREVQSEIKMLSLFFEK